MTIPIPMPQAQVLEALGNAVRMFFPDARTKPLTEEAILLVARALPEEVQESLFGEVLGAITGMDIPADENDRVLGYYAAHATHERFGVHRFTETLPLVRVLVPEQREDIATAIGIVYAGDHARYTLPLVRDGYRLACEALAQKAETGRSDPALAAAMRACAERAPAITSVERYTPARHFGARFGAIAVDVLFAGTTAIGYRMTGGMATGESMVDYTSPTLAEMQRATGYEPTPLSDADHYYTASIELKHRELIGFEVAPSTGKLVSPYARIAPRLERVEPDAIFPSVLTARAAMRMAAVCEWMGRPFTGVPDFVAKILAAGGRDLAWEKRPDVH